MFVCQRLSLGHVIMETMSVSGARRRDQGPDKRLRRVCILIVVSIVARPIKLRPKLVISLISKAI